MVNKGPGQWGGYGWKPGLPDFRDYKLHCPTLGIAQVPQQLPEFVDLSVANDHTFFIDWCYDQGKESSCTGQSIGSLARFVWKKDLKQDIKPSRHFIYWNERELENDTAKDAGAEIGDGMKVLLDDGFCLEDTWGFSSATLFVKPPQGAYTQALSYRIKSYFAVEQQRDKLQACLASGYPFVMGFVVFSSFETYKVAGDGMMPIPQADEKLLGGHAVMCVGYDNRISRYKILNSWSNRWGVDGYFFMPYEYMEHPELAGDFYTLRVADSSGNLIT